jgi:hypothetical protein
MLKIFCETAKIVPVTATDFIHFKFLTISAKLDCKLLKMACKNPHI